MVSKIIRITDATGIHARPATILVNNAGSFKSNIKIDYNGKSVNIKSIMGVMSLGIPNGASINIVAEGSDEQEALNSIYEVIVKEGLGE